MCGSLFLFFCVGQVSKVLESWEMKQMLRLKFLDILQLVQKSGCQKLWNLCQSKESGQITEPEVPIKGRSVWMCPGRACELTGSSRADLFLCCRPPLIYLGFLSPQLPSQVTGCDMQEDSLSGWEKSICSIYRVFLRSWRLLNLLRLQHKGHDTQKTMDSFIKRKKKEARKVSFEMT